MRSAYIFLAVTSGALVSANPLSVGLFDRDACNADNCARAVTGTGAQPASTARKSDCSSFMSNWTYAAVPTYASACSGSVRYSSACSCYGVTATSTSSTPSASSTTTSTTTSVTSSSKSKSSTSSSTGSSKKTSSSTGSRKTTTSSTGSSKATSSSTGSRKTTSSSAGSRKTTSSSTGSRKTTSSSTGSRKTTSTTSKLSSSRTSSRTTTTTTTACLNPSCLSDAQATAVVNSFIYLLANPTASNFISKANDLLCNSFTDTSDSINSLAGIPLGDATFTNKTAFVAGSGSQPPLILKTYDIFHSCRNIAWRWVTVKGAGNDAEEVKGIDTFYTDGCGHICQIFAEFNSAAWLYNLGDPECSPTSMISFASTLTSTTASATNTASATTTSA